MEEVSVLKKGEPAKYFNNKGEIDFNTSCDKRYVDSNGFLHSINDQPAYVVYHGKIINEVTTIHSEHWFNHGRYHRLTGPTFIRNNEDGSIHYTEYWINNKELTKEQWEIEVNRYELLNER